jgi:hypothetical protein
VGPCDPAHPISTVLVLVQIVDGGGGLLMLVRHWERPGEGAGGPASDRGSALFEWLALGVVAALIVGGLAPTVGPTVSAGVTRVICRIVHVGGSSHCAGVPAGRAPKTAAIPQAKAGSQPCLISVDNPKADRRRDYTLLLYNIGQGYKVIRYDTREKGPDGKTEHFVYLAFVNKSDTAIDQKKAADGTKIDIGGGYKIQYGHLYRMTPADAKKLTAHLGEYEAELATEHSTGNPGVGFGDWLKHMIKGEKWPPKITDTPGRYGNGPVSGYPSCGKTGKH